MVINPRQIFVDIAAEEVGVRETSRNQGPGIEKYWADTSYPDGFRNREPYCSAFVCWVVAEARRRGHAVGGGVPRDAAVRNLVAWAERKTNGALVFRAGDARYHAAPGDLVFWKFNASHPNHVGIVERVAGARLYTIEANTDGSGSREGDGVYRRTRTVAGAAGFIRLSWKAKRA